jgi:hypothetical protein
MKIAMAIGVLVLTSLVASADNPSLLLVARQTTIKRDSTAIFDVYLCNTGAAPVTVPSLRLITISAWTRNVKDITSPTAGSAATDGETSTNPPLDHALAAHAVEARRLEKRISAQPGDVVEVSAILGQHQKLRSNSVLLFCPAP